MTERHELTSGGLVSSTAFPVCRLKSGRDAVESASRRVLVVGEDNPLSSHPEHALFNSPSGCAGHRLQSKVMRLESRTYLALWRTNLCSPTWNAKEALHRWFRLTASDVPWTKIVCLGAKVSGVASVKKNEMYEVSRLDVGCRTFSVLRLPHPSGRCFEWNDETSYHLAMIGLKKLEPELPWGEV